MFHLSGSRSGFDHLPDLTPPARLLLLAADGKAALLGGLRAARDRIAAGQPARDPLPRAGRYRLGILATDTTDLVAHVDLAIRTIGDGGPVPPTARQAVYYSDQPVTGPAKIAGGPGKIAFLFPGQGSQHAGMLGVLCLRFPRFRGWLEELDAALGDLPVPAPSLLAYQPSDLSAEHKAFLARELYELRGGAQLLLAANLGVLELVSDLGVRVDAMLGHSNGEHAALFGSGIFRPDRRGLFVAMRRMAERALALPPATAAERVITVAARDRAMVEKAVAAETGVYLAMINCPSQLVIAGRADAVARVARTLSTSGAIVVPVPLDRAFHTPLFADWGRWLRGLYDDYEVGPARTPLYSSMTAELYPAEPGQVRDLAAAQWSNPVDFDRSVRRLYDEGVRTFVEVGPGNKLSGFVGDILRGRDHVTLPTSSARDSSLQPLQRLVARLFVDGQAIDLESATARALLHPLDAHTVEEAGIQVTGPVGSRVEAVDASGAAAGGHRTQVIESHFALMREFLDQQARVFARVAGAAAVADVPLADHGVINDGPLMMETVRRFDLEHDPVLRDHSLGSRVARGTQPAVRGLAVLPFTFTLDVVAQAALALHGRHGVVTEMSSVRGSRWLALDRGSLTVRIAAEATPDDPGLTRVRVFDLGAGRDPLAFEAIVRVGNAWPPAAAPPDAMPRPAAPQRWSVADFYRDFAFHGPAFQGIQSVLRVGPEDIEAELRVVPSPPPAGLASAPPWRLDPALLDCSGQLVGFWLLEQGRRDFGIFPYQLRHLRICQAAPAPDRRSRGRAQIRWQPDRSTDADVSLSDEDGRPIYLMRGFEQRYIPLPRPIVRALFIKSPGKPSDAYVSSADAADASVGARIIDELPRGFLEQSWGIWGRALAHQSLTTQELDDWYDRHEKSTPWLLARIAGKEAIVDWLARTSGVEMPATEVGLEEGTPGSFRMAGPNLAALPAIPVVQVNSLGDRVTARIRRQTRE